MADISDALRSAIYAHMTGGAALVQPAGLEVALFDGPLLADEITDANYARQLVTFGAEVVPGAGVSDAVVEWDPMDAIGEATHFCIFDSGGAGMQLSRIKALDPGQEWIPGGIVRIPIGEIAQAWA